MKSTYKRYTPAFHSLSIVLTGREGAAAGILLPCPTPILPLSFNAGLRKPRLGFEWSENIAEKKRLL
jgi:hypothetical protein